MGTPRVRWTRGAGPVRAATPGRPDQVCRPHCDQITRPLTNTRNRSSARWIQAGWWRRRALTLAGCSVAPRGGGGAAPRCRGGWSGRRGSRSTAVGPDSRPSRRFAPARPAAGQLRVDRIEGASRGAGGGSSDGVAAGDEVPAVHQGGGGAWRRRPGWTGVRRGAGAGGVPAGGPAADCQAEGPPSAGSSRRSRRTRRGTWVSHPGPAWWPGAERSWCRSRGQVASGAGRTVRVGRRSRSASGSGSAVAGCRAGRRGQEASRVHRGLLTFRGARGGRCSPA
jgi:hypothetical protein